MGLGEWVSAKAEPSFEVLNSAYERAKNSRSNRSHATKSRFYNIANDFELLKKDKTV
jgi:hypothetical protein